MEGCVIMESTKIGTKAVFRSWLEINKNMTHTEYTKLSPEKKTAIQKEYSGRGKKKVEDGTPEA